MAIQSTLEERRNLGDVFSNRTLELVGIGWGKRFAVPTEFQAGQKLIKEGDMRGLRCIKSAADLSRPISGGYDGLVDGLKEEVLSKHGPVQTIERIV